MSQDTVPATQPASQDLESPHPPSATGEPDQPPFTQDCSSRKRAQTDLEKEFPEKTDVKIVKKETDGLDPFHAKFTTGLDFVFIRMDDLREQLISQADQQKRCLHTFDLLLELVKTSDRLIRECLINDSTTTRWRGSLAGLEAELSIEQERCLDSKAK